MSEGQDLEALPRAPPRGLNPLGTRKLFFGEGSLPRWYSLRGRSPAYPLFRKEKVQPHRRRRNYDAESPERVLLRSYCLQEATLCHARNPPAIRFAPGPPPAASSEAEYKGGKRFLRLTKFEQKSPCGAGSIRTQGGAFFFTKKASCGNQTLCVAGGGSLYRLDPPLFPPLKKPLKITGSKGI